MVLELTKIILLHNKKNVYFVLVRGKQQMVVWWEMNTRWRSEYNILLMKYTARLTASLESCFVQPAWYFVFIFPLLPLVMEIVPRFSEFLLLCISIYLVSLTDFFLICPEPREFVYYLRIETTSMNITQSISTGT